MIDITHKDVMESNSIEIDGIEFVKVVHGEWIPMPTHYGGNYYYMGCSVCSCPMPTDSKFDFMDEEDNKFCYNCGAKMDATDINVGCEDGRKGERGWLKEDVVKSAVKRVTY